MLKTTSGDYQSYAILFRCHYFVIHPLCLYRMILPQFKVKTSIIPLQRLSFVLLDFGKHLKF